MSWDAIGAIGEMIGSFAVLVTLVYVAIQVRVARSETARAISRSRSDDLRDHAIQVSQSEWLSRISAKADAALGGVPRTSATRRALASGNSEQTLFCECYRLQNHTDAPSRPFRVHLLPQFSEGGASINS